MGISRPRDLDALRAGLVRWALHRRPEVRRVDIDPLLQPSTGLSSDTILAEVTWDPGEASSRHESWVVRLPPDGDGLFPRYDLTAQGRVQAVLADAGIPAVRPLAVEEDDRFVGAPFMVMPRLAGRVVQAEQPYLRRGWLADASVSGQAAVHRQFVDALAGIHAVDWRRAGCDRILSARSRSDDDGWLAPELRYWEHYLEWASEGAAPDAFAGALHWCRAHLPRPEPPASLLWGDVQLGNVLVDEDMALAAVLDFEMATIGPAEADVAWLLVLHDMAVARCGGDLPGFLSRAEVIARHQAALGRPLTDLRWYEAFAALRSGAILVRAARLLSRLGIDDSWLTKHNPTVEVLARLTAD
jgi:aminoglycoside phosphotransferase (APT) family kinase protein